ncbi:hypothetical protein EB796_002795 [Bugula neritina]|uniref:Uncharacterized protein n=1 Tax=Bugula neritina TaxID=10212 RepID=A0A7J7KLN6_BUGNE|nr:hypothetical protein EB796_002795 [Bugula neritina]
MIVFMKIQGWSEIIRMLGEHDSITSVEGSHADLPTYPPALQRVQPWVTCESVISELESNPTMFWYQ